MRESSARAIQKCRDEASALSDQTEKQEGAAGAPAAPLTCGRDVRQQRNRGDTIALSGRPWPLDRKLLTDRDVFREKCSLHMRASVLWSSARLSAAQRDRPCGARRLRPDAAKSHLIYSSSLDLCRPLQGPVYLSTVSEREQTAAYSGPNRCYRENG
ncbi:hypothetical protein AOLI_G00283160 [Acnodon oligacanthus]